MTTGLDENNDYNELSFVDAQDLLNELLSRFDAAVFLASQVRNHHGDSTFSYQHIGPHPFCYGLLGMAIDKLRGEKGHKEQ